jgi:hypothetical protein
MPMTGQNAPTKNGGHARDGKAGGNGRKSQRCNDRDDRNCGYASTRVDHWRKRLRLRRIFSRYA